MLDVRRDRRVRKVLDEGALPVGAEALRIEGVEGAVQRRVRQRTAPVGDDRSDIPERLEDALGLVERAGPVHHHQAEGVAVPVLRDERQRRRDLEPGEAAELLRRVPDELVEHPKHGGGVLEVVEDRPGEDLVDLVEAVLQRRHDAEVAAAAPQPPEEILVLALARGEELPVRGDHVG